MCKNSVHTLKVTNSNSTTKKNWLHLLLLCFTIAGNTYNPILDKMKKIFYQAAKIKRKLYGR